MSNEPKPFDWDKALRLGESHRMSWYHTPYDYFVAQNILEMQMMGFHKRLPMATFMRIAKVLSIVDICIMPVVFLGSTLVRLKHNKRTLSYLQ